MEISRIIVLATSLQAINLCTLEPLGRWHATIYRWEKEIVCIILPIPIPDQKAGSCAFSSFKNPVYYRQRNVHYQMYYFTAMLSINVRKDTVTNETVILEIITNEKRISILTAKCRALLLNYAVRYSQIIFIGLISPVNITFSILSSCYISNQWTTLYTERNAHFLRYSVLETLGQGQLPQVILSRYSPENYLHSYWMGCLASCCWVWSGVTDPDAGYPEHNCVENVHFFRWRVYLPEC